MNRWDELKTALYVHELGTVSAAAEALGVHRATVIRHIDALEEEMGTEMFRRHAQGYTATEACAEALVAVKQAERLFSVASGKVQGIQPVRDKTRIVVSIVAPTIHLLAPGIGSFLEAHPNVRVELDSSDRLVQLDSGEADLVIRAGARPREPGVLVEPFTRYSIGLYAVDDYLEKHSEINHLDDLVSHLVVGPNSQKQMPFAVWARRNLPADCQRLHVDCGDVALGSTLTGTALGLLPSFLEATFPQLRLVHALPKEMDEQLWLAIPTDGNHPELVADLARHLKRFSSVTLAA
ncbi:MAG: LysR family transcriptional regulator [Pseudomonadota bacterium]